MIAPCRWSRPGLVPRLLFLSLVLAPACIVVAGDYESLPHPRVSVDPRWLRQLPPVSLPLEKPAERAAVAPPMAPEPAAEAVRPALPAAPAPVIDSALADTGSDPEPAPEVAASAEASQTSLEVESQAGEATEDAAMIEVLETFPIAGAAPETTSAPAAEREAPVGPAAESDAVALEPVPESPYRWHVQILAGRALDLVKEDQRLFVVRYGDMLRGMTLTISQSRYGDARDEFYRLRVEEWTTKQPAVEWCGQLGARGHQCYVTRILRRVD